MSELYTYSHEPQPGGLFKPLKTVEERAQAIDDIEASIAKQRVAVEGTAMSEKEAERKELQSADTSVLKEKAGSFDFDNQKDSLNQDDLNDIVRFSSELRRNNVLTDTEYRSIIQSVSDHANERLSSEQTVRMTRKGINKVENTSNNLKRTPLSGSNAVNRDEFTASLDDFAQAVSILVEEYPPLPDTPQDEDEEEEEFGPLPMNPDEEDLARGMMDELAGLNVEGLQQMMRDFPPKKGKGVTVKNPIELLPNPETEPKLIFKPRTKIEKDTQLANSILANRAKYPDLFLNTGSVTRSGRVAYKEKRIKPSTLPKDQLVPLPTDKAKPVPVPPPGPNKSVPDSRNLDPARAMQTSLVDNVHEIPSFNNSRQADQSLPATPASFPQFQDLSSASQISKDEQVGKIIEAMKEEGLEPEDVEAMRQRLAQVLKFQEKDLPPPGSLPPASAENIMKNRQEPESDLERAILRANQQALIDKAPIPPPIIKLDAPIRRPQEPSPESSPRIKLDAPIRVPQGIPPIPPLPDDEEDNPLSVAVMSGQGVLKKRGISARNGNHLVIQDDGRFGALDIDMNQFHRMNLRAMKGGKVVAEGAMDADLFDLLTKRRFNKRKVLNDATVDVFRRLVDLAEIPKTIGNSAKNLLLQGRMVRGGAMPQMQVANDPAGTIPNPEKAPWGSNQKIRYISDPNEMIERLNVLMGSVHAGNENSELVEEASEILDKLKELNFITNVQYEGLLDQLIEVMQS